MSSELNQQLKINLVSWPTPQDYNEALQIPQDAFGDVDLAAGQPKLNVLGLPRPITGALRVR